MTKKAKSLSATCAKCSGKLELGVGHICPKAGPGRPRIGSPMPIAMTDEQKRWVYALAHENGETFAATVRGLIDDAMAKAKA